AANNLAACIGVNRQSGRRGRAIRCTRGRRNGALTALDAACAAATTLAAVVPFPFVAVACEPGVVAAIDVSGGGVAAHVAGCVAEARIDHRPIADDRRLRLSQTELALANA